MKSYNHKCIKACINEVGLLYISIIYELISHLQMMSIISLTALSAVLQGVVSVIVSTTRHSNAYRSI